MVAARALARASRSSTSRRGGPPLAPLHTRGAFRRFFDSGVSAERVLRRGRRSRAALRRAGTRYARGELALALAHGPAPLDPYAVVYELAKLAGLQLGLRHERIPVGLKRRMSSLPALWRDRIGVTRRRRTGAAPGSASA